jgi:hypothetical protein
MGAIALEPGVKIRFVEAHLEPSVDTQNRPPMII